MDQATTRQHSTEQDMVVKNYCTIKRPIIHYPKGLISELDMVVKGCCIEGRTRTIHHCLISEPGMVVKEYCRIIHYRNDLRILDFTILVECRSRRGTTIHTMLRLDLLATMA